MPFTGKWGIVQGEWFSGDETSWKTLKERIPKFLPDGERVVIHCAVGLHRTGAVSFWIVLQSGLHSTEALAHVKATRPATEAALRAVGDKGWGQPNLAEIDKARPCTAPSRGSRQGRGRTQQDEDRARFIKESIAHLVQDDNLVSRIHDEELPPDEHYDELVGALKHRFPKADPELVEHVVALAAAFDTANLFASSFGIDKF